MEKSEKIDILTKVKLISGNISSGLELVRLDGNETMVIPFTTEAEEVTVHYCDEPDLLGYLHCNGSGCVLCQVGKKAEERVLIPVYQPKHGTVGVLTMSLSLRPQALLPQFTAVLESQPLSVLFLRRDGSKFSIGHAALEDGMDDGAGAIADFQKRYGEGKLKLSSVYARMDNERLAQVPQIRNLLRMKGLGQ